MPPPSKPSTPPLVPQSSSSRTQRVSELVTIAATFMTVPGMVVYVAILIAILLQGISLAGNPIMPLLMAFFGMGLMLLVLIGIGAGLWNVYRNRQHVPRTTLTCLWTNAIVLAGMIAMILLIPQLK